MTANKAMAVEAIPARLIPERSAVRELATFQRTLAELSELDETSCVPFAPTPKEVKSLGYKKPNAHLTNAKGQFVKAGYRVVMRTVDGEQRMWVCGKAVPKQAREQSDKHLLVERRVS